MPSHVHETLVELFRERPALAAELLGGQLGVRVPTFQRARLSPGELTDVVPTEYRADAVVTLTVDDFPVTSVVVEVQLRIDARKRRTWPVYVATLHAKQGCPVFLLVVCPTPAVAAWCAEPVVVSEPGLVLTPVVLGPEQVPLINDPAQAQRSPEAAVLSAMAHGGRSEPDFDRTSLFDALLAGLDTLDQDHAELYTDVVLTVLPQAARDYLEGLMAITNYEFQSDFARRHVAQGEARGEARGKAEGEARAVLAVLEARGVDVPDGVRRDIASCTDLDQLDVWIRRAVTATTIEDLLETALTPGTSGNPLGVQR